MVSETFPIDSPPKGRNQKFIIMHSEELPIEQKFSFITGTEFAFYHKLGPTLDVKREEIKRYEKLHPRKDVHKLILK